jgi:hypothetical protein
MSETWRAINTNYDASSLGRIRSCRQWPKVRILKPRLNKNGYLQVMLGRGKCKYVHELVLIAFHGSRPGFSTASHINGKRTDNRPENLIWESHRDNCARQAQHGTKAEGERSGHARLTAEDVWFIRTYPKRRGMFAELARKYGVGCSTIEDAYKQRTWRNLKWPTTRAS